MKLTDVSEVIESNNVLRLALMMESVTQVGEERESNAQQRNMYEILLFTIERNMYECLAVLLGKLGNWFDWNEFGPSCLYFACRGGFTESVRTLIEINSFEHSENTLALKASIEYHQYGCLELLVNSPVVAYSQDDLNEALHIACEHDNSKALLLLLKYDVDTNNKNRKGGSPLHTAIERGSTECLRILLAKGTDLSVRNLIGLTPLHLAVKCQDSQASRLLLQKGANPNEQTRLGLTPLHYIATKENVNLLAILLHFGSDPSVCDNEGRTPVRLAHQKGLQANILLMTQYGANPINGGVLCK